MAFRVQTWPEAEFASAVARVIADSLPSVGTFVLTGGRTAAAVYGQLAGITRDWSGIEIFFSDERCVPPTDENSNYNMVKQRLLHEVEPGEVFRIRGEEDPNDAASEYDDAVRAVDGDGFDLAMFGMGAEGHIGALFPGSPALASARFVEAVDRPDGMKGVTLTPRGMLLAKKIYIVERSAEKADAVARAVNGDEPADVIPVRLLADHPDATFLLDEAAASRL